MCFVYDDCDYKAPVDQFSHSFNYVFPGRVLTPHQGRFYSLRDLSYPERGGLLAAGFDLATGNEDTRFW